jgi:hypothetical protein
MSALFPRWANTAVRVALIGGGLAFVGLPVALMAWVRTPNATNRGAPVAQPIAFDHRLHVHDFRIDCRYCHAAVERSATAGIPPTTACVACHNRVWMEGPLLAPVRRSLATGRPIRWRRVTRLPDFVYFDHSAHVAKGVGCESCHGRVDQMARVVQTAPLTMTWCLDCHRTPERQLRPVEEVTTMGWRPPVPQAELGATLKRRYHVRELTTCTACHR